MVQLGPSAKREPGVKATIVAGKGCVSVTSARAIATPAPYFNYKYIKIFNKTRSGLAGLLKCTLGVERREEKTMSPRPVPADND